MSDSSEKTISEYEKDAFEEEPIEEYVEEEGLLIASDNMSEISEEPDIGSVDDFKGSIEDLTASTADMQISSNTPSDFNSDDHALHLDFIRASTPKLAQSGKKTKNGTRYNFSFSNDRMREIERHNRILLQKILSKGQSCIPSTNQRYKLNTPAPPPPRLSSAAINRKKQQRQIDLDNQILKCKIEQIAARRPRKQLS
ncbi:protein hemingway isoform X2 [Hermetia illucens]|nr:protein hemingway isoform X2 [Hermetia illucens]XP_037910928.1 protein hemingway isoform X2 [Hermetia illucens]